MNPFNMDFALKFIHLSTISKTISIRNLKNANIVNIVYDRIPNGSINQHKPLVPFMTTFCTAEK